MRAFLGRFFAFLRSGREPGADLQAPTKPVAPADCPSCSGRLDVDGPDYFCTGTPAEDVAKALAARGWKPKSVMALPACGWRDKAEGFGRDWW